jgi:hypothetical protein
VYTAPRIPRAMAPARGNSGQYHPNLSQARTNNARLRANTRQLQASPVKHRTRQLASPVRLGGTNKATNVTSNGLPGTATGRGSYVYGYGLGARSFRAYGYGNGYRNRVYGRRYGYGRSQSYNRAIVARLRSVRMNLARISHNYNGHRARAMHAISMAVRQLTHRSMIYSGVGFAPGMNNGMGMGMGIGRGGLGAGGRQMQPMTQAQSDARMSQSLRTLQGINMQLANQSYGITSNGWAIGHVQRAIRELHVALAIR